jgi:hypothetical protein
MNITQELRKNVDVVFEQFEEFKQELEKYPYGHEQKKFFKTMEKFHAFLTSFEDEKLCNLVQHSEKYEQYEQFFRSKNDYFMRAIETVQALDIMNRNIGVDSSLANIMSEKFIKEVFLNKGKALRLLDLEGAKKMVMVGSGPFPDTSLYVYENTDIPELIGLDNNEEAVFISSQFIENMGFSSRIHLKCVDVCDYDYEDADIVYIAGFVPPKHRILEQIVKTSTNPNIQILVDSTSGMKKLLFEDISDKSIHKRLKVQQIDSRKSELYRWEMIKLVKYDI